MKHPRVDADPWFCPKCGKRGMVTDDAEPFFDTSTGKPHYYSVDRCCSEHGQLNKPRKKLTIFGIPLYDSDL